MTENAKTDASRKLDPTCECDGPGSAKTYSLQVCLPLNGKVRCIDRCLHKLVAALNAGGVETVASCCGHGQTRGRIDLADGRVLALVPKGETVPGAVTLSDLEQVSDEMLADAGLCRGDKLDAAQVLAMQAALREATAKAESVQRELTEARLNTVDLGALTGANLVEELINVWKQVRCPPGNTVSHRGAGVLAAIGFIQRHKVSAPNAPSDERDHWEVTTVGRRFAEAFDHEKTRGDFYFQESARGDQRIQELDQELAQTKAAIEEQARQAGELVTTAVQNATFPLEERLRSYEAVSGADIDPGFGVDPGDSAGLLKLRQCVDDHLEYPDEETEESGDYEAAVVHSGKLLVDLGQIAAALECEAHLPAILGQVAALKRALERAQEDLRVEVEGLRVLPTNGPPTPAPEVEQTDVAPGDLVEVHDACCEPSLVGSGALTALSPDGKMADVSGVGQVKASSLRKVVDTLRARTLLVLRRLDHRARSTVLADGERRALAYAAEQLRAALSQGIMLDLQTEPSSAVDEVERLRSLAPGHLGSQRARVRSGIARIDSALGLARGASWSETADAVAALQGELEAERVQVAKLDAALRDIAQCTQHLNGATRGYWTTRISMAVKGALSGQKPGDASLPPTAPEVEQLRTEVDAEADRHHAKRSWDDAQGEWHKAERAFVKNAEELRIEVQQLAKEREALRSQLSAYRVVVDAAAKAVRLLMAWSPGGGAGQTDVAIDTASGDWNASKEAVHELEEQLLILAATRPQLLALPSGAETAGEDAAERWRARAIGLGRRLWQVAELAHDKDGDSHEWRSRRLGECSGFAFDAEARKLLGLGVPRDNVDRAFAKAVSPNSADAVPAPPAEAPKCERRELLDCHCGHQHRNPSECMIHVFCGVCCAQAGRPCGVHPADEPHRRPPRGQQPPAEPHHGAPRAEVAQPHPHSPLPYRVGKWPKDGPNEGKEGLAVLDATGDFVAKCADREGAAFIVARCNPQPQPDGVAKVLADLKELAASFRRSRVINGETGAQALELVMKSAEAVSGRSGGGES